MSQENVAVVKRMADAYNRRDVEALLEELDPEIEWHPLLQVLLGGEATVYRGHEACREGVRDLDEAFADLQAEQSEVRDLGEQVVAIGHLRGRGRESGAQTETAIAWLVEFKDGKAVRVREYVDPEEALEAAGLAGQLMSQENVEVVRKAVDAMNRRDPDAFIALLRPDVEWEESGNVLPGLRGVYRGRAEVRRWFERAFLEVWESFHIEVEEITEASADRVLVGTFLTARGTASGVETELRSWTLTWHAEGRVARRQVFFDRDDALEAAGLRE